jgi:galactokinase
MVEISFRQRGVYGVRMTGGGFGGCTISLVEVADATEFQRRVAFEYQYETGRQPRIYICSASQGVEAVNLDAFVAQSKSGRETREVT